MPDLLRHRDPSQDHMAILNSRTCYIFRTAITSAKSGLKTSVGLRTGRALRGQQITRKHLLSCYLFLPSLGERYSLLYIDSDSMPRA